MMNYTAEVMQWRQRGKPSS